MSKKILSTVAASLMILSAGLVAAPSASAYPAGSDPVAGVVGSNKPSPRQRIVIRVANFTPGCTAVLTVDGTSITRTKIILANGERRFKFRAPAQDGKYTAKIKQTKVAGKCAGFSDATSFTVN